MQLDCLNNFLFWLALDCISAYFLFRLYRHGYYTVGCSKRPSKMKNCADHKLVLEKLNIV